MGREYQQDLRLIVGIDETTGGLAPAEIRDSISGSRAISYTDQSGNAQTTSGAVGETLAPAEASTPALDPNDQQTSSEDGIVSADSLLNESMELGDTLKELIAEDCLTGVEQRIRTDGDYVPPQALFAPNAAGTTNTQYSPDWEDANTPPIRFGFNSGTSWHVNIGTAANPSIRHTTGMGSIEAGLDRIVAISAENLEPDDPFLIIATSLKTIETFSDDTVSISYLNNFLGGGEATSSMSAVGDPCNIGVDDACPVLGDRYELWTVDPDANEGYVISLENGEFSTNEFDGQAPNNFDTKGQVDFCTAGGKFGRMEPLADGGFAVVETSTQGGSAIGTYKVFNNSGVLTSFVGDEAIMDALRPNDPTL